MAATLARQQTDVDWTLQSPGNSHQTLQVDQRVSILCSIIDEPITLFWQKRWGFIIGIRVRGNHHKQSRP